MGQGLVDFVLGAAVIVAPQHQLPVAVGAGLLKAGSAAIQHRSQTRAIRATAEADQQSSSRTTLDWDQLSCTLTRKDGTHKNILQHLSGTAQPGRSAPDVSVAQLHGLHGC